MTNLATLCLDSKNGGSKLVMDDMFAQALLCLDSKNGGSKLDGRNTLSLLLLQSYQS